MDIKDNVDDTFGFFVLITKFFYGCEEGMLNEISFKWLRLALKEMNKFIIFATREGMNFRELSPF